MSSFVDNDLTTAGIALLTELELGASFEPTKIVMGSGYMPSGSTARTMTEATLQISKWERSGTDKIVIGAYTATRISQSHFTIESLGFMPKRLRRMALRCQSACTATAMQATQPTLWRRMYPAHRWSV